MDKLHIALIILNLAALIAGFRLCKWTYGLK